MAAAVHPKQIGLAVKPHRPAAKGVAGAGIPGIGLGIEANLGMEVKEKFHSMGSRASDQIQDNPGVRRAEENLARVGHTQTLVRGMLAPDESEGSGRAAA